MTYGIASHVKLWFVARGGATVSYHFVSSWNPSDVRFDGLAPVTKAPPMIRPWSTEALSKPARKQQTRASLAKAPRSVAGWLATLIHK